MQKNLQVGFHYSIIWNVGEQWQVSSGKPISRSVYDQVQWLMSIIPAIGEA
jgi:hypothetical protein